jgi:hypothetical protein
MRFQNDPNLNLEFAFPESQAEGHPVRSFLCLGDTLFARDSLEKVPLPLIPLDAQRRANVPLSNLKKREVMPV